MATIQGSSCPASRVRQSLDSMPVDSGAKFDGEAGHRAIRNRGGYSTEITGGDVWATMERVATDWVDCDAYALLVHQIC